MPPSSEGSMRTQSSPGAESGSNCSSLLPSCQNGAHSPIEEESDNGAVGRTEPYPLDAKDLRPDSRHQPDGSSATRDTSNDGKDYVMDANSTMEPEFVGECPDASPPKKRKLETAESLAPANDVAFQSPLSSQDRSKSNKRLKIDHVGGTTTVSDVDMKLYRDASGHLPLDKSKMPPEVWHYVFSFIPPEDLARLLRVNRAFNKFLTPPADDNLQLSTAVFRNTVLRTLEADSIWSASRKLFYSDLPRPPHGMSELDMWKLLCGRTCQFCGKSSLPVADNPTENQFEPGPGENGVKIIWQFRVRSCGSCLQERSEKVGNFDRTIQEV
jgi:F-box domain